jgi:antitoxin component of MazEF toxin-antitoxin module
VKVKVRRVGNSLTVTIPKEIAVELSIRPDTEMDVTIREETVVLEPVESRWERLVRDVRQQLTDRGVTEDEIESAVAEARGRQH